MWSEAAMERPRRKFASRIFCAMCALALGLLTSGAAARAQDAATAPPPPSAGPAHERGRGPMPPDAIEFVGFQAGLTDKVIAGAPFSATFTTESSQTLADGNVIQRKSTGSIARDSQGRTRRDMTMPAFGPLATSDKTGFHVSALLDPVANAGYVLDADTKTARKIRGPFEKRSFPREGSRGGGPNNAADAETLTTSLGTQTVGGVSAEGTRYTRTIPVGEIGNAKPIVIVSERWYSPDLQMVVMTKRTDPRMGETSFQMTNIARQEPAASLFQVPADYTLKQGGPRRGARPANGAPPLEQ
jgi:hypothetical protein